MDTEPRTITFPNGIDPSLIASEDETRYILNHVLIEDRHAIATDGRTMLVAQIWDSAPQREPLLLTKDAVATACGDKTRLRNCYPSEGERLKIDPETGSAIVETMFPKGEIRFDQPGNEDTDRKFPNWSQVLPRNPEGRFCFQINPWLLLKLAKSLGVKDGGGVSIHIDLAAPLNPAFVTASNQPSAFGIIMPMRDREGFEAPPLSDNHAIKHGLAKQP